MPLTLSEKLVEYPEINTFSPDQVRYLKNPKEAAEQEIRPLRIALYNLMPFALWTDTEKEWFSHLGQSSIQVEPILVAPNEDRKPNPKKSAQKEEFYTQTKDIQDSGIDGLIVLGANCPENLSGHFNCEEIKALMNWARENVCSTIYSCWSAHAALEHLYKTKKTKQDKKIWGVFPHEPTQERSDRHALLAGMDDEFKAIHSRWNNIPEEDLPKEVTTLVRGSVGWHLAIARKGREIFLQGHPEYNTTHLSKEAERDQDGSVPENYFRAEGKIVNTWGANGELFFRNWINFVLQNTHFNLKKTLQKEDIHFY